MFSGPGKYHLHIPGNSSGRGEGIVWSTCFHQRSEATIVDNIEWAEILRYPPNNLGSRLGLRMWPFFCLEPRTMPLLTPFSGSVWSPFLLPPLLHLLPQRSLQHQLPNSSAHAYEDFQWTLRLFCRYTGVPNVYILCSSTWRNGRRGHLRFQQLPFQRMRIWVSSIVFGAALLLNKFRSRFLLTSIPHLAELLPGYSLPPHSRRHCRSHPQHLLSCQLPHFHALPSLLPPLLSFLLLLHLLVRAPRLLKKRVSEVSSFFFHYLWGLQPFFFQKAFWFVLSSTWSGRWWRWSAREDEFFWCFTFCIRLSHYISVFMSFRLVLGISLSSRKKYIMFFKYCELVLSVSDGDIIIYCEMSKPVAGCGLLAGPKMATRTHTLGNPRV